MVSASYLVGVTGCVCLGVYCFGDVIDLLLDCFVGWVVLRWFYVGL